MQKIKKKLHICKNLKKKSLFRKCFFATGLVIERFLASRSRFFEKVNGFGVLGLAAPSSSQLRRENLPPFFAPVHPTRGAFEIGKHCLGLELRSQSNLTDSDSGPFFSFGNLIKLSPDSNGNPFPKAELIDNSQFESSVYTDSINRVAKLTRKPVISDSLEQLSDNLLQKVNRTNLKTLPNILGFLTADINTSARPLHQTDIGKSLLKSADLFFPTFPSRFSQGNQNPSTCFIPSRRCELLQSTNHRACSRRLLPVLDVSFYSRRTICASCARPSDHLQAPSQLQSHLFSACSRRLLPARCVHPVQRLLPPSSDFTG
ncbi:hypothetical protein LXL04_013082 [Taraxacum kok-saghyz]